MYLHDRLYWHLSVLSVNHALIMLLDPGFVFYCLSIYFIFSGIPGHLTPWQPSEGTHKPCFPGGAGRGVSTLVKEKGRRSEGKASWKGSQKRLLSRDAFIMCLAATCRHLFIFLFSERILHQQILLKRFYLTCRRILCASNCLLKSLGRLRGKSAAIPAICIGQVASCCQYAQATWPRTQPSVPLWPAGSNLAAFQGLGALRPEL